jgi:hypothetical protein
MRVLMFYDRGRMVSVDIMSPVLTTSIRSQESMVRTPMRGQSSWAHTSTGKFHLKHAQTKSAFFVYCVTLCSHNDDGPNAVAPGADDDGSGTTTILEVYRALLAANFTPTSTVEFHWYAAEEGGYLGSAEIAQSYEDQGVHVIGMLQVRFFCGIQSLKTYQYCVHKMDATAWVSRGTREEIGVCTTFVDLR